MIKPYYQDTYAAIYYGDCLEIMPELEPHVDMILADLPYGTTACKWDTVIPFEPLWKEYKRLIKDNGAIVLTASQPFTSALVMSNPTMFKYEWVWQKPKASNFLLAKKQPLKNYEDICVFYKKQCVYNPQLTELTEQGKKRNKRKRESKFNRTDTVFGNTTHLKMQKYNNKSYGYPKAIIKFNNVINNQFVQNLIHPTQKPIPLFSYLIRTYTNEGDTVFDNCMGSGTTLVAAKNLGRKAIGIEISQKYCDLAIERLKQEPLNFNTV